MADEWFVDIPDEMKQFIIEELRDLFANGMAEAWNLEHAYDPGCRVVGYFDGTYDVIPSKDVNR